MYTALGSEFKALKQSEIILKNQINDAKTLQLLSDAATDESGNVNIGKLQSMASRYPDFEYVAAAVKLYVADLLAKRGRIGSALASYQTVFNGPAEYAKLAKERYQSLKRSTTSQSKR